MEWLGVSAQNFAIPRLLFHHHGSCLETVNKQAGTTFTIRMRQEVEQLKSCRVREICGVCVSIKELRCIGCVLEGEVGREIPKST